jgi:hypothetical protein
MVGREEEKWQILFLLCCFDFQFSNDNQTRQISGGANGVICLMQLPELAINQSITLWRCPIGKYKKSV